MTHPHSEAAFPGEFAGFDSQDSEILLIDGPGDTTVRPPSEYLLPILLAEREKLARLQDLKNRPPASNQ
jgi:hypothetical protein